MNGCQWRGCPGGTDASRTNSTQNRADSTCTLQWCTTGQGEVCAGGGAVRPRQALCNATHTNGDERLAVVSAERWGGNRWWGPGTTREPPSPPYDLHSAGCVCACVSVRCRMRDPARTWRHWAAVVGSGGWGVVAIFPAQLGLRAIKVNNPQPTAGGACQGQPIRPILPPQRTMFTVSSVAPRCRRMNRRTEVDSMGAWPRDSRLCATKLALAGRWLWGDTGPSSDNRRPLLESGSSPSLSDLMRAA